MCCTCITIFRQELLLEKEGIITQRNIGEMVWLIFTQISSGFFGTIYLYMHLLNR